MVRDLKPSPGPWRDRYLIALLVVIIVFGALCVNMQGDFSLNDDWSYGAAVKYLLVHHRYKPTWFTSMSLIFQVFWGALICKLFGFSFFTLRLSTLAVSSGAAIAMFTTMRTLNINKETSLVGALLLLFNPLFVTTQPSTRED